MNSNKVQYKEEVTIMFELIPIDRALRRAGNFDPFRDFDELERRFFGSPNAVVNSFRTDVMDNGDAYVLEAELPGFTKENINIDIENDCLTISAERKLENEDKKHNFVKRERFYGSYTRSFDVSGINVDGIEAKYENGILTLHLPKKAAEIPASRKLEIK